jgi:enoyl-CoA hydratase/carnithine racemase
MLSNYIAPELETLALDVREDHVVVMTVNRPDRMNSMTMQMFQEFETVARALRDTDARALVIHGAGDRAFCAGFDLEEIDRITTLGVRGFLKFQELASFGMAALHHLPFPVIAAVQGAASGGGLALALVADIRLASPSAGELGMSWQLTRLLGPGIAAEFCFTGRNVDADEAARIGLVNRVVPQDRLLEEALVLASTIAGHERGGIRFTKRALTRNQEVMSYTAALELENRGQATLVQSPGSAALLRGLATRASSTPS